jgi:hypothetical protein
MVLKEAPSSSKKLRLYDPCCWSTNSGEEGLQRYWLPMRHGPITLISARLHYIHYTNRYTEQLATEAAGTLCIVRKCSAGAMFLPYDNMRPHARPRHAQLYALASVESERLPCIPVCVRDRDL